MKLADVKDHNPPLFVYAPNPAEANVFCRTMTEITLRDLFAGAAVQGYLATPWRDAGAEIGEVASYAYTLADALLAERAKGRL